MKHVNRFDFKIRFEPRQERSFYHGKNKNKRFTEGHEN